MDHSASAVTKDAARNWRRRSCTPPRFSSTLPVRLVARRLNNISTQYPAVVQAVSRVRAKTGILDGELVAVDDHGRPSFQALQHRASTPLPVVYYAFGVQRFALVVAQVVHGRAADVRSEEGHVCESNEAHAWRCRENRMVSLPSQWPK